MKDTAKNEWIEWLKAILIATVLAFLLRSFVFATSIVEGESMDPALEDGERVLFNKFIYMVDDPEREEIVIIKRPKKNYVKRVIGLPQETVEIIDHTLYIDGEKYKQNFLNQENFLHTRNFGPVTVPESSFFVMGDNRGISKDSRNGLGFIARNEIIGRSELIIYPFKEWSQTR